MLRSLLKIASFCAFFIMENFLIFSFDQNFLKWSKIFMSKFNCMMMITINLSSKFERNFKFWCLEIVSNFWYFLPLLDFSHWIFHDSIDWCLMLRCKNLKDTNVFSIFCNSWPFLINWSISSFSGIFSCDGIHWMRIE